MKGRGDIILPWSSGGVILICIFTFSALLVAAAELHLCNSVWGGSTPPKV